MSLVVVAAAAAAIVRPSAAVADDPPPATDPTAEPVGELGPDEPVGELGDEVDPRVLDPVVNVGPDEEGGWVALPGPSYTPDNGLTLGGALLRYFRTRDTERPSRVGLSASYSFRDEYEANLDPEVWFAEGRWGVTVGSKFAYQENAFFGVGNDAPDSAREDYRTLRFEGRLEVMRRLPHGIYVGLLYAYRQETLHDLEPGGLLRVHAVPGADGGVLSGVGASVRWDTRDNVFGPRRGWALMAQPRIYDHRLGSDADFGRLLIDGSFFFNPWLTHVFAIDARIDLRSGDPPFDELALAGGKRFLRGMLEGRLRDRHFAMAQVEYRLPLFWRFGGAVFCGAGRVAHRLADLTPTDLTLSVGGGIRFAVDRDERINIRADLAHAGGQVGTYVTILEAF